MRKIRRIRTNNDSPYYFAAEYEVNPDLRVLLPDSYFTVIDFPEANELVISIKESQDKDKSANLCSSKKLLLAGQE